MPKAKVTVSLDREKVKVAQDLVGARSTSAVIDLALDRLVREERIRRDIDAYRRLPPTDAEVELGSLGDVSGLGDDTDWEALYAEDE